MKQAANAQAPLGEQQVWDLLLRCARETHGPLALGLTDAGAFEVPPHDAAAVAVFEPGAGWRERRVLPEPLASMLALYLPICHAVPGRPVVVGHLGQSLDGYVATASGDSAFVNDPRNIVHLHRMRALCDAVVVGGATVRDDDPRLTVRHATGRNPLRVVIDPRLQLDPGARLFTDGAAETLVVCTAQALDRRGAPGQAEAIVVPTQEDGRPVLAEILAALTGRGCRSVFVEGGGITVTRFLEAGLLDRVQVAVAPFFIGEGRRGISLPGTGALADCPRPRHRMFRMGADLLFDLDLREPPALGVHGDEDAGTAPVRVA